MTGSVNKEEGRLGRHPGDETVKDVSVREDGRPKDHLCGAESGDPDGEISQGGGDKTRFLGPGSGRRNHWRLLGQSV
jgi:hypothetical protein